MRRWLVAFTLVTLSATRAARGDEPATEPTQATDIVVRAPRREIPATSTQVLREPFIERSGATNVGQALETIPALHASQDSRGERVLTLQGFSQRQVAVFVDGVPVLVPYDGQLDLSKFPIDMIDRITIVKGSSATLYGPNGLGGAINMSTREPREDGKGWVRARTEANTYTTRSSVVGGARAGALGATLGASFENQRFFPMSASFTPLPNENGGRRNDSDRLGGSVAGKATYDVDDAHRVVVVASRFEGTFGVPPGTKDFSVRYWRWTDWYSSAVGAGHEYRGKIAQTEAFAYASFVGNTLDGYDDARYQTQRLPRALHSVYDDTSLGGFVRATIAPELGDSDLRIRLWAGAKRDTHTSFDNTHPEKVQVATNLLTLAALGEVDPVPRRLRAKAGIQGDAELPDQPPSGPVPDSALGIGPMGALTLFATESASVTASAALRTRFPTLRERFSTVFGTRDPNPQLRPERSLNLGVDGALRPTKTLRVALGLFDSELRDLITTVIVGPQRDQLQNASRARIYGAEAQVEWSPTRWLELLWGGLVLHARSGGDLDAPVNNVPAQKALGMITVRPVPRVALSAIERVIGPQDYANPNTGVQERLAGHALCDARAEVDIVPRILRSWMRVTNLFDADVEGRYSFPEPGRQFFVGLSGETP